LLPFLGVFEPFALGQPVRTGQNSQSQPAPWCQNPPHPACRDRWDRPK